MGQTTIDQSTESMIVGNSSPTLNDCYHPSTLINTDHTQIDMGWDDLHFDESHMLLGSSKNNMSDIRDETNFLGTDSDFNPDHLSLTKHPWPAWTPPEEYLTGVPRSTAGCEQPNSTFLSKVQREDPVSSFAVNIIAQMLCAFPQMMLRRETLPPFIHGHWYRDSTAGEPALPKPLANCTGIAQVFASQSPECKTFLWDSIKTELHVSNEKVMSPSYYNRGKTNCSQAAQLQFSREELLAATQAHLIYIMMRVIDNSKPEAVLNREILASFLVQPHVLAVDFD